MITDRDELETVQERNCVNNNEYFDDYYGSDANVEGTDEFTLSTITLDVPTSVS